MIFYTALFELVSLGIAIHIPQIVSFIGRGCLSLDEYSTLARIDAARDRRLAGFLDYRGQAELAGAVRDRYTCLTRALEAQGVT